MNTKVRLLGTSILAVTTLSLTACGGGGSSIDSTAGLDTPHPKFSRELARVSSAYQPVGDIQDTTPTFEWKAEPNATWYMFGHEDTVTDSDWHDYTVSAQQAGCLTGDKCSYTPDDIKLAVGEERAWWVRARTPQGWQPWSDAFAFRITDGSVQLASSKPISPEGEIDTISPVFKWTPGNGATHYQFGIENEESTSWDSYTITAEKANCQPTECSYLPDTTILVDGDKPTWWVRSKVNSIWSEWSEGLSFSVKLNVVYTPFENTPNVTSIVEANGKWYGLLGTEILEDDGAGNVTTIFTTQYGFNSELATSISGKLYFVTIKSPTTSPTYPNPGSGHIGSRELFSLDLSTYQVVSELVESRISIRAYMTNFLIFSKRHKSHGHGDIGNPTRFYKIDNNSEHILLGYSQFGNKFWIQSIDDTANEVHVKIRKIINSTAVYTYHKITSAIGVGLEDE